MAEVSKVPSPASLWHYQHTDPAGQEATTTQDTLLPGPKNHFLVLSTLIHHKRKNPPRMLLPGLTPVHHPGTRGQHSPKDRGHLAIQEQGKGSAGDTSVAAPHPVRGQEQSHRSPQEGQLCPHLTWALPSARRKPLLWRWIPLDTPLVEVLPFCTSEG